MTHDIAALRAAYEAARKEFGADVEAAREVVAHWESFHNGAIREERGEHWYLSDAMRKESASIDDEMSSCLPRVMSYLETTAPLITAQAERITALEAIVAEVRKACTEALAHPAAHSGSYTFVEYQPYEEILDIVDPEESDNPAVWEEHFHEYVWWLTNGATPMTVTAFHEWHAAAYPDCNCTTFRRASERASGQPVETVPDAAAASWALFYPGGATSIDDQTYTRDSALKRAGELAESENRAIEVCDVHYGDVITVRPVENVPDEDEREETGR